MHLQVSESKRRITRECVLTDQRGLFGMVMDSSPRRAAPYPGRRKRKAALLEGNLETLQKLVKKGKKLSPDTIRNRIDRVSDCAREQGQFVSPALSSARQCTGE